VSVGRREEGRVGGERELGARKRMDEDGRCWRRGRGVNGGWAEKAGGSFRWWMGKGARCAGVGGKCGCGLRALMQGKSGKGGPSWGAFGGLCGEVAVRMGAGGARCLRGGEDKKR